MIAQGWLPFQYEAERAKSGMTGLAGLPAYLEMSVVCGLADSIRRHMHVCAGQTQGWSDPQIVVPMVLLNVVGGDAVGDVRILEADDGFKRVLHKVEWRWMKRRERREQERRWRKERKRTVPSPTVIFRYLGACHNEAEELKRVAHKAFIPAPNEHLRGLVLVNKDLLQFTQNKSPQRRATLDQDATLVDTFKAAALYCYQGEKSYQPLTTYWAEQDLVVTSEFRDGNVPAGFDNLRVLQVSLEVLPNGVDKVYYRGDTAAYQQGLLRYCAEGKNERFGVIEFAVGVDVTAEFKRAVAEVKESDWHPLDRIVDGRRIPTDQEWAEVCFVPNWVACGKKGVEYRFLAIREILRQQVLPGMDDAQLPFPTMDLGERKYKLFGVVTNRHLPGDELIRWHRKRCGKSEEVHDVMKNDLAGGKLPSGLFGANAAWWGITVLAYNLSSLMKRLAMPKEWWAKRLKAIRFEFINLAGRVLSGARQLKIRISADHPAFGLLFEVRRRMRDLAITSAGPATAQGPP